MTGADQRMVPGASARSLWRAVYATLFISVALCALVLPVAFVVQASHRWTQAFGGATLLFLAAVTLLSAIMLPILIPAARKKQRQELHAGYTTLMPEFDQVDGISPSSKCVVRPAKIAASAGPDGDRITTGTGIGAFETGRTPLQIALRRRTAAIAETASLVALFACVLAFMALVLPAAHPSQTLLGTLILVGVVAFCVAITVPAVVIVFAPIWYYTARLRTAEAAPTYATTPSNPDIVTELAGIGAVALPASMFRLKSYLMLKDDRMTLYSRHGTVLVPYLDVPRSRIGAARVGSSVFGTGGSPVRSPVLTFRKDNGTELEITFSLIGPDYRSSRRRLEHDSQDIVDWADGSPPPS